MAKEIERKFLVGSYEFRDIATESHNIRQGYISRRPEGTVRVRIRDNSAFLTIKGKNSGVVRDEWEYPIPISDAIEMLAKVCDGSILDKIRWIVPYGGFIWEIDEFHGALDGLVLAEIELPDASTAFPIPPFIAEEVTGNPDYYNSNLLK